MPVTGVVNVSQEVSQHPARVRTIPWKVLARRLCIRAERNLGFEHLDLYSRGLGIDEVDKVDKEMIDGLV